MAASRVYARAEEGPLRQGLILTGLVQAKLQVDWMGPTFTESGKAPFDLTTHPFVVVLSQDCDLDWDHRAREDGGKGDKRLPSVLFCEAIEAKVLRGRSDIKSDIWKRIRLNKDERYQFLQRIPPEEDALGRGLPELGIDFKRYFTIPTDEVYGQLKAVAKRRARLVSPYLEHLGSRFCHFQSRVALPAEHLSEP